jgi:hypothetical protein
VINPEAGAGIRGESGAHDRPYRLDSLAVALILSAEDDLTLLKPPGRPGTYDRHPMVGRVIFFDNPAMRSFARAATRPTIVRTQPDLPGNCRRRAGAPAL